MNQTGEYGSGAGSPGDAGRKIGASGTGGTGGTGSTSGMGGIGSTGGTSGMGSTSGMSGAGTSDTSDTTGEAARKMGQELKAGAREAVKVGKERTRSFIEDQKATVADQMEDLATMLRRAAREHDEDGGRASSVRLAESAADGMERMAGSLQQRDLGGFVRNCENFARRSPAVFIGGALTAGFLLTRFLKSSRDRHDDGDRHEFGAGTAGMPGTSVGSTYPTTTTTTSPAGRAY